MSEPNNMRATRWTPASCRNVAPSPYRRVVGVHVVKGVHMAADMEQVTLHHTRALTTRAHTHTRARRYLSRVLTAPVLRSTGAPSQRSLHPASVLRALPSPRKPASCSSPSDTHTHSHTRLHFLLCLLQQEQRQRWRQLLVAMGTTA